MEQLDELYRQRTKLLNDTSSDNTEELRELSLEIARVLGIRVSPTATKKTPKDCK